MVQNDAINFDLSFLHTQMQFVSGDKIDTNYVVDELINNINVFLTFII
jgi:hypothetical protein